MRTTLSFTFFAISLLAFGHNSKIATMNLGIYEREWLLQMSFAQNSFDRIMQLEFTDEEIQNMPLEDIKKWVTDYVIENSSIEADGNVIQLDQGGIKLGSHQTDLSFVLKDFPITPELVTIKMPIGHETANHTNIFRIFRGDEMTKFFLSAENDFQVNLVFSNDAIVERGEIEAGIDWILPLLVIGSLIVLVYRGNRRKSSVLNR